LSFCQQSAFANNCLYPDIIKNGGFAVTDQKGELILSCNPDKPYIPASILKIATALAGIRILGPDFRFKTELYMDNRSDLYIKGFGDPMLTSEEVDNIIKSLIDKGVKRINGIFVDQSAFALEHDIPGRSNSDNPYDAPIAALAVNFNTVFFEVMPNGMIASAERQTPVLPIMSVVGGGYPPGQYRFNIVHESGSIEQQVSQYAIELFRSIQRRRHISGYGATGIARVPKTSIMVLEYYNSRTLKQMLSACLKYSNNFIANQIYLACGSQVFGYPANWGKAHKAVSGAIRQLVGPDLAPVVKQIEGSGLSRQNTITPRTMVQFLRLFTPYKNLLPDIEGDLIKSGTMENVFSYAGYLGNGNPFVIILNQQENTRDQVLHYLRIKLKEFSKYN